MRERKRQTRRNRRQRERVNSSPKCRMNYRILGLVRKAIERKRIPLRPLSVTHEFWSSVGYNRQELCDHLEALFHRMVRNAEIGGNLLGRLVVQPLPQASLLALRQSRK